MKSLLFLFLLSFAATPARAHNYYFGFAEMQYNATNHTLETTIVLSAHDLEDHMIRKGLISKSLEYLSADSAAVSAVGKEILENFDVRLRGRSVHFETLGFEVTRNGMINIYLLAKNVTAEQELQITFTCLMDVFPEQQNKLTFIKDSRKYTAVFLPHQKSAVINIQ